jgi:hypothetical protein
MRELNVWLACWFCSAPTETHGDGSTTPVISGHSGTLGFGDTEDDGPDAGDEDAPCCVPHATTSTSTTAETPVSNSLSHSRTDSRYATTPPRLPLTKIKFVFISNGPWLHLAPRVSIHH